MPTTCRLIGFDRETERLAATYEIPAAVINRAKEIAGISNRPEIIADWPLTPDQAALIAEAINQSVEITVHDWFLEL